MDKNAKESEIARYELLESCSRVSLWSNKRAESSPVGTNNFSLGQDGEKGKDMEGDDEEFLRKPDPTLIGKGDASVDDSILHIMHLCEHAQVRVV